VVIKNLKTCGMTTKMETRFMKSIATNEGEITVRAKLNRMMRNIAVIDAQIFNHEGELCSKAELHFFTFPQDVAKEKFYFRNLEEEANS
jgi:acyl-coenzyme A thioesterase PaaI-like protein